MTTYGASAESGATRLGNGLTNVEVLGVNFAVFGQIKVLLGYENAFYTDQSKLCIFQIRLNLTSEEILVDLFSIRFGNEP